MGPRIAIPLPTSTDPAYNRLNNSAYAEAVRACGAEPVEISLDASDGDVARLARECDGVLLPGSPADVDPALYGQARDEATAAADARREMVDRLLLEEAYFHRKPILGICFGVQFLNVLRGGTLVQDLTVLPVNHAAGRSVAIAHAAAVAEGTLLAEIVDSAEAPLVDGYRRLPVNSSHHQAVAVAGSGLTVSARCPQDGVVEAVEGPYVAGDDGLRPHFVVGVQWHPERTVDLSSTSRAIFARFVDEAAAWREAPAAAAALAG
jgi:putative glutamine amidotransferase